MSKIINEVRILDKYTVLIVDEMPDKPFHNILINGKIYKPIPVYDAKNAIAVPEIGNFIKKTIQFI